MGLSVTMVRRFTVLVGMIWPRTVVVGMPRLDDQSALQFPLSFLEQLYHALS